MSNQNKESVKVERIQGSWKNKITASELVEERQNCNFDREELLNLIAGDENTKQTIAKVHKDMKDHPQISNTHKYYEMDRQEKQESWMKKLNYMYNNLDKKFYFQPSQNPRYLWHYAHLGQPPLSLHLTMFSNALDTFCDDEQRKTWIPLIQNCQIIGCYAQTEIGHGSDVASLQTTAIFDKKTDEFIINTPSQSAVKWWPGELGRYANFALVFAKILIPEDDGSMNDYGIAPFIVQIRCRDTHKHLTGIKTGDMGPKFGYSSKDNGWMSMENIRIPRSQMPCRYMKVERDGSFQVQGDPRILYSTMMRTRVLIFSGCRFALHKSALIGIRYSIVRRQFKNISGQKQETKLLDYQTQQMKLFPIIAMMFAHSFITDYTIQKYDKLIQDIKKQDFSQLEVMHHLSAGLKCVQTQDMVDSIILVRQALGGAGYSAWSRIPSLLDDYSPTVTFEGDNTMLAQQSFNYLMKLFKRQNQGKNAAKVDQIFQYLNEKQDLLQLKCKATTSEDFLNLNQVEESLKVSLFYQLSNIFDRMKKSNASKKDFVNSICALDIVKITELHIRFITFFLFKQKVQSSNEIKCKENSQNLTNLCLLYGLMHLNNNLNACYESGYFNIENKINYSNLILESIKQVNLKIRPHALNIVESLEISDDILQSAIGNSYGDIYETHLEWAKDSKLNHTKLGDAIPDGFMENIMPILKSKL